MRERERKRNRERERALITDVTSILQCNKASRGLNGTSKGWELDMEGEGGI